MIYSRCYWRPIKILPPKGDRQVEEEEMCIIIWDDAENPPDTGREIVSLAQIRDGDFNDKRYSNVWWRSIMDAEKFRKCAHLK